MTSHSTTTSAVIRFLFVSLCDCDLCCSHPYKQTNIQPIKGINHQRLCIEKSVRHHFNQLAQVGSSLNRFLFVFLFLEVIAPNIIAARAPQNFAQYAR